MEKLKRKSRGHLRFLGLLAFGMFPMACATTSGVPVPDSMTVSRAQAQWPGTTLVDLQQGRTAYVQNCAACHNLHDASEFSPSEWKSIMVKMRKKAHLDDVTNDAILHYLSISTTKQDEPGSN